MNTQSTKPPAGSGTDPRPAPPQATPSPTRTAPSRPGGYQSSTSAGSSAAPLQPVIDDAAATARTLAKDMKETAQGVASDTARVSADLSSDLKQAAQSAQRAAKAQASEFAADLGHELGQTAEEQKVRGVEAMQGFARAINTAASELEDQSPKVARYVRDAANSVETLSNNLRGKSVTELMRAASDLARSQPVVFLAGAVASGFVLSRFLKSSASRNGADGSFGSSLDDQRGGGAATGRPQATAGSGVTSGRS
jgi:hypothetical protein